MKKVATWLALMNWFDVHDIEKHASEGGNLILQDSLPGLNVQHHAHPSCGTSSCASRSPHHHSHAASHACLASVSPSCVSQEALHPSQ